MFQGYGSRRHRHLHHGISSLYRGRNLFIPSRRYPILTNTRGAFAIAETYIFSELAYGVHPLILEEQINNALISYPRTDDRYHFLRASRRILRNMRRANQFGDLMGLGDYRRLRSVGGRGRIDWDLMMWNRFSRFEELRRHYLDEEMEREIANTRALNREAEEELRILREQELMAQEERCRDLQAELANARFDEVEADFERERRYAPGYVPPMGGGMGFPIGDPMGGRIGGRMADIMMGERMGDPLRDGQYQGNAGFRGNYEPVGYRREGFAPYPDNRYDGGCQPEYGPPRPQNPPGPPRRPSLRLLLK